MGHHFSMNEILNGPAEGQGSGRVCTANLESKDTSWIPGLSKRAFKGPGKIRYTIRPEGIEADADETIKIVPFSAH